MSLALGRNRSDEYRPGLRKVTRRVQGQTGLLFTNASEQEVLRCFYLFCCFVYNSVLSDRNKKNVKLC